MFKMGTTKIFKETWERQIGLGFVEIVEYGVMEIADVITLYEKMCSIADIISKDIEDSLSLSYKLSEGKATRKKELYMQCR